MPKIKVHEPTRIVSDPVSENSKNIFSAIAYSKHLKIEMNLNKQNQSSRAAFDLLITFRRLSDSLLIEIQSNLWRLGGIAYCYETLIGSR